MPIKNSLFLESTNDNKFEIQDSRINYQLDKLYIKSCMKN